MSNKFRLRRPSPAMIVAIVAVVAATAGTSIAAINLSKLTNGAKDKTVGVGKLTYVTTTTVVPKNNPVPGTNVSATCPSGLHPIGGGIKVQADGDDFVNDSHPTSTGWAGTVYNSNATLDHAATVSVACAKSRVVTGSPPAS